MNEIEKRDRLAEPEPAAEKTYGEGFIAIHMKDGSVVTISGIVDLVERTLGTDDFMSWNTGMRYMESTGWNVTVHFVGDIVEEIRPMDGKEGSQ